MNRHRLLIVAFAASCLLAPLGTSTFAGEHDSRDIRHRIADAYGVHSFGRVEKLSFTFNVKTEARETRRSWTWWPRENRIRYDGGTWRDNESFEYNKSDLDTDSTEAMVEVDQRFINDSYWLMFPYYVEWDLSATVTDEGMAPRPIGDGEARKVVVDYPDTGGYTPGDIYELYVGKDYRMLAWVFRPGGSEEKRYPITWGDEQRFGDVTFSTDHVNADGTARIYMSDISVEFKEE